MKHTSLLICLISLITGCAGKYNGARIAVLQNPQTKQTVECKVNPLISFTFQSQVDTCVTAYKKAGYVLVSDSAEDSITTSSSQSK